MRNRFCVSSRALAVVMAIVLYAPTFVVAQSLGTAAKPAARTAEKTDNLVEGSLFDQSGRHVEGALVRFWFHTGLRVTKAQPVGRAGAGSVWNDQEGMKEYHATTDKDGHYRLSVPVGTYNITIEVKGQTKYIKTDRFESIGEEGGDKPCLAGCAISFDVKPDRNLDLKITLR